MFLYNTVSHSANLATEGLSVAISIVQEQHCWFTLIKITYNHKQWSQSAKDRVEKILQCYHCCVLQRKITALWKKERWGVRTGHLFYAPLLAVYNIMQSSMICNCVCTECSYWIPFWCWWQCPSEWNLIQLLSLKATNNQTLPTLQQAEQWKLCRTRENSPRLKLQWGWGISI